MFQPNSEIYLKTSIGFNSLVEENGGSKDTLENNDNDFNSYVEKQNLMKQRTTTIQLHDTKLNAIKTTCYSDNTTYVSNHTSMNHRII